MNPMPIPTIKDQFMRQAMAKTRGTPRLASPKKPGDPSLGTVNGKVTVPDRMNTPSLNSIGELCRVEWGPTPQQRKHTRPWQLNCPSTGSYSRHTRGPSEAANPLRKWHHRFTLDATNTTEDVSPRPQQEPSLMSRLGLLVQPARYKWQPFLSAAHV